MNRESLEAILAPHRQQHVLRFWDELNEDQRERLAGQVQEIDLDELDRLIAGEDEKPDFAKMAAESTPPPAVDAEGQGASWRPEEALTRGEEALRAGKVGAIVVAGGQGTRLGFDKPKGMFPIGPVSNRTLFQLFADRIKAVSDKYGVRIPFYVMVSEATDAATREYFAANDYLGLPAEDVQIFQQGTMPAVDAESGKLLLAEKGALALSPDGHGGTVRALDRTGKLDDAQSRGIEHLFYFQVDNPLINLLDPTLIGHHLMSGSEMTTQVVRKRYPKEKVGNVVMVDGRLRIIEYSDLPDEAAEATNPDGSLKIWAGSIAVHVIAVDFLRRMSKSAESLPFHRASKKVPFINEQGVRVEPESPNAIKFERFIFDLLPSAENGFVIEGRPSEAFAPVKNAEGAPTDTASLARQAIVDLHRGWLEKAGASVDEGAWVEINPRYALTADELAQKIDGKMKIEANSYFDR